MLLGPLFTCSSMHVPGGLPASLLRAKQETHAGFYYFVGFEVNL